MFLISIRDLQWRRRRFFIAVLATGLVFSMTLLLSGMSSSFGNEVDRTVEAFGADAWVVPSAAEGPFTNSTAFPASVAEEIQGQPGVKTASPLTIMRLTLAGDEPKDVMVFGAPIGGLRPEATSGREVRRRGEAVVDSTVGKDVGDTVEVGGVKLRVVGTFDNLTAFAGTPTMVVSIADAREMGFASQPLALAIVVKGHPSDVPAGYRVVSSAAAAEDLRRPLKQATGTIGFLNVLLWIIAAGIIGSIVYLTAIERTRDFAVLKATGFTGRLLFGSLAIEAVTIALFAAAVAAVIALGLSPALPMRVETSTVSFVLLPCIAVIVGLLASLVGMRRAVGVDPALAFG